MTPIYRDSLLIGWLWGSAWGSRQA
jgi:hypothetical protein